MKPVDINPAHGLQQQATYFPHDHALIYEGQNWSYQDFYQEVGHWASLWRDHGVSASDRVAYLGFNSSSFLFTAFSAWWLGAVFEPLNFRLAAREIDTLLVRSTPRVLVVEPALQKVLHQIVAEGQTDLSETVVVLVDNDPAVPVTGEESPDWLRLSQELAQVGSEHAELPTMEPLHENDLSVLMFTSGTTGKPKGVPLTHGNLWWNSINVDSLVDTRRGDTNLAVAPLFHIGALNALTVRNIVRGGRTLVRRGFDPAQTLQDIAEYQVQQAFLVPAMVAAMQKHQDFETYDISSLRTLICAGAPVPPVLLKQYESRGVPVQQAWGLTETAPFATYLPTEFTYSKPGSCGIPMPHTNVRVVDAVTGNEVTEPGVKGELWVKGPNVITSYWNDPDADRNAFVDGWFRSGDIGYRDEDGYLYIVDRLKDMIITGGENVYPAEVERALMEFPGVLDVAVVGAVDEQWGEAVVAVMSVKSDRKPPTLEEVRDFTAQYLARYKLPKRLLLVDDVPRNGTGKLNKPTIVSMVHEGQESSHEPT